jgi:hypothetical protein
MLVGNLHEESLVAQRIVYDAIIESVGSVSSVVVDNALLTYVRGSHARYQTALEQKRKAQSDLDKHTAAKKRAAEQIKELQAKKASLVQTATAEATKIEVEIAELKKNWICSYENEVCHHTVIADNIDPNCCFSGNVLYRILLFLVVLTCTLW